jgi:hypothetical protein
MLMNQKAAIQLRSGSRKSAPMPDASSPAGENLAEWLQESAKRPWTAGAASVSPEVDVAGSEAGQALQRPYLQNVRELVALTALTIGYLQYYYLDVMVQIGNLHRVVVFVPVAAA